MRKFKKMSAALFSTGILVAGIAAPSAAAQSVVTGGLVNVTVVDVIDDVTVVVQDVNVGVGVAANVAAAPCAPRTSTRQFSRSRSCAAATPSTATPALATSRSARFSASNTRIER
jgi:hypothetical protein